MHSEQAFVTVTVGIMAKIGSLCHIFHVFSFLFVKRLMIALCWGMHGATAVP